MRTIFVLICCLSVAYLFSCNKEKKGVDNECINCKSDSGQPQKAEPLKISLIEQKMINCGLVNVSELDSTICVELKYATKDNFTKTVLYDTLENAYLHPLASEKLLHAQKLLKKNYPNLSLLVYDAARPLSVQKRMYAAVQGTKYKAYLANPARTGLHNYGIAVDLTVCDSMGAPLDMGTKFDFFGKEAGIRDEKSYLTKKQLENRLILRRVMTDVGFLTVSGEWWHFNALPLTEAKKKCRLIE